MAHVQNAPSALSRASSMTSGREEVATPQAPLDADTAWLNAAIDGLIAGVAASAETEHPAAPPSGASPPSSSSSTPSAPSRHHDDNAGDTTSAAPNTAGVADASLLTTVTGTVGNTAVAVADAADPAHPDPHVDAGTVAAGSIPSPAAGRIVGMPERGSTYTTASPSAPKDAAPSPSAAGPGPGEGQMEEIDKSGDTVAAADSPLHDATDVPSRSFSREVALPVTSSSATEPDALNPTKSLPASIDATVHPTSPPTALSSIPLEDSPQEGQVPVPPPENSPPPASSGPTPRSIPGNSGPTLEALPHEHHPDQTMSQASEVAEGQSSVSQLASDLPVAIPAAGSDGGQGQPAARPDEPQNVPQPEAPGKALSPEASASSDDASSSTGSESGSESDDNDDLMIEQFVAQAADVALQGLQLPPADPADPSTTGAELKSLSDASGILGEGAVDSAVPTPDPSNENEAEEGVDYQRLIHLLQEPHQDEFAHSDSDSEQGEDDEVDEELGNEELDALAWSALGLNQQALPLPGSGMARAFPPSANASAAADNTVAAVVARQRSRKRGLPDDGLIPSEALPPARITPRPGIVRKYRRTPVRPMTPAPAPAPAPPSAPSPVPPPAIGGASEALLGSTPGNLGPLLPSAPSSTGNGIGPGSGSVNPASSTRSSPPGHNEGGDERKLQCKYCGRMFNRAYNLSTHEATHDPSKAKRFQCPYRTCQAQGGRTFSRKHDLQRHVASAHEFDAPPEVLVRADGSAVPVDYDNPPWNAPPKRKRGRPRKNPLPPTTSLPDPNSANPSNPLAATVAGAAAAGTTGGPGTTGGMQGNLPVPTLFPVAPHPQTPGVVANGLNLLGLDTPKKKFRCETCGRAFVRRDALHRHACTQFYWPPSGSDHLSTGPGRPRKTPLLPSLSPSSASVPAAAAAAHLPSAAGLAGAAAPGAGFGFMPPNPGWFYGLPPLPAVAPGSDSPESDSGTQTDSSSGTASSGSEESESDSEEHEDEEDEAIRQLAQQATESALSAYQAAMAPEDVGVSPSSDHSLAYPPAPPSERGVQGTATSTPMGTAEAAPVPAMEGARGAPTEASNFTADPPQPASAPVDAAHQVQAAMAAAFAEAGGMDWEGSSGSGSESESGSDRGIESSGED